MFLSDDVWLFWHALYGVLAAALRWSAWKTAAIACAWEWVEAVDLGPFGQDPSRFNSVWDVGVALFMHALFTKVIQDDAFSKRPPSDRDAR